MKIAFEKLTNLFERRNIKIDGFDRLIFITDTLVNLVVAIPSPNEQTRINIQQPFILIYFY